MDALIASLTALIFLFATLLRNAAIIGLLVGALTFAGCVLFPSLGHRAVRLLRLVGLD